MARTWRKGEADYKHSQDYKNRRNKRKEKANSHYSDIGEDYQKRTGDRGNHNTNLYYDLDTDID